MQSASETEDNQEPYGEPDQESLKYRIFECIRRWANICCGI